MIAAARHRIAVVRHGVVQDDQCPSPVLMEN